MNVLFLTIGQIQSLNGKSVHIDLIKALRAGGHSVSVLCTREARLGYNTELVEEQGCKILRLKIGDITKCSMIKKGINTLKLEGNFKRAVKKYFSNDKFDLIIYNTPPITLAGVVKYCKKRFKCKTYLILKDIFPQNALDINLMSKKGVKGLLYKLFRKKEVKLYKASDRIGCMSKANIEYLLSNNPYISRQNVELFPNAVFMPKPVTVKNGAVLDEFGLNKSEMLFVYGGNLGKPQGLDFLVNAISACEALPAKFVIVGNGSERARIFERLKSVKNAITLSELPPDKYSALSNACDVGIVALDYRFTIPNYPSRILSYMENSMPVLACTDKATDVKELVESLAACGKWCYSNSIEDFVSCVKWFIDNRQSLNGLGQNGRAYLEKYFNTDVCVEKLERFVAEG